MFVCAISLGKRPIAKSEHPGAGAWGGGEAGVGRRRGEERKEKREKGEERERVVAGGRGWVAGVGSGTPASVAGDGEDLG
ncbi:hypothetical protein TIFTF001_024095 [Ficus carica]|uniref:Uncharacterized protein n=1 Tax=Ficus carica TaxID=3494 RepID=A0AA88ALK9_FICCA|nr:hypothetical protein TIFTF001_024095 [Ficus carica]